MKAVTIRILGSLALGICLNSVGCADTCKGVLQDLVDAVVAAHDADLRYASTHDKFDQKFRDGEWGIVSTIKITVEATCKTEQVIEDLKAIK